MKKVAAFILVLFLAFASILQCTAVPLDRKLSNFDCRHPQRLLDSFYIENDIFHDAHSQHRDIKRASPASVGLKASTLEQAAVELQRSNQPTSLLVARKGKLVFERYFNEAKPSDSINVHSASKSLLSIAAAVALENKQIASLDQPVFKVAPELFAGTNGDARKKLITFRHLLNMQSGLAWKEDRTERKIARQKNWAQAILQQPLKFTPGTKFNYSTGDSHLLAAALSKAVGENLCSYLDRHLFSPLKVRPEMWVVDPQGVFSGGFNFFFTPRELLKIGLLLQNNGRWNDRQIFPEIWMKQLAKQRFTYQYKGYQNLFWLKKIGRQKAIVSWGFGGQRIFLIPSLELVIVITTDTKRFESEYSSEEIVKDYLFNAVSVQ